MTMPMPIKPGRYWFITRRTLMRTFLLMPKPWVAELFDYAVSRASNDTGVCVIGGLCMSTHYHLVVFDPTGDLPRFVRIMNELLARAGNAELGREDHFFESAGTHYLRLLTRESIEEMLVYALTNPCEARLVARSRAWGGWQTQPEALGRKRVVSRPALAFFSERSVSPVEATLELLVPATHAHMGPEGFGALIARRVRAREDALRAEHGGRCLGMDKVLSFHWTDRAGRDDVEARDGTRPRSKAGQVEHAPAIHAEYEAELEAFWSAHRAAYESMRLGEPTVFPWGTYKWRVVGGQACADPPSRCRAVHC